jgi:hypothetical protein
VPTLGRVIGLVSAGFAQKPQRGVHDPLVQHDLRSPTTTLRVLIAATATATATAAVTATAATAAAAATTDRTTAGGACIALALVAELREGNERRSAQGSARTVCTRQPD